MTRGEARALLQEAVTPGGTWADLGAGAGTFTRELAELLGPNGVVWAIDQREEAVRSLRTIRASDAAPVRAVRADFTQPLDLPPLDGILLANALHFVEEPEAVLRTLVGQLRAGARFLLIEYDQDRGNPWVPYPIPPRRFQQLALAVGLGEPRQIGRRRSSFGREMYAAVAPWGWEAP